MDSLNLFESEILVWIQNNLRNPVGNAVMPFFSLINEAGAIAILMVVILMLWKRYRAEGITAAASLIVDTIAINVIIKPIADRIRPYDVNSALTVLGIKPTDDSFPSGHTGAAFAVAFVMLFTMPKKYGITAIVVASLISLSRLYNGVHYPSDVLVALIIAILSAVAMTKLVYSRLKAYFEKKKLEKNENSDVKEQN